MPRTLQLLLIGVQKHKIWSHWNCRQDDQPCGQTDLTYSCLILGNVADLLEIYKIEPMVCGGGDGGGLFGVLDKKCVPKCPEYHNWLSHWQVLFWL